MGMGVMRFVVYPKNLLEDWPELQRAYVSGFDGRVFPTRIEVEDNVIACRRTAADSGKVHIALPIEGFGRPSVSTSSLPEREAPFLLAVELARGRISQLRDQLAAWEMAGMAVPAEYWTLHKEAHVLFADASSKQHRAEEASQTAWKALEIAFQASKLLSESYTAQRLAVRRKRSARLPAALGCNLGRTVLDEDTGPTFCDAFTAVRIPIEWKHIEPQEGEYAWEIHDQQIDWAQEQKLLMSAGPLFGSFARWFAPMALAMGTRFSQLAKFRLRFRGNRRRPLRGNHPKLGSLRPREQRRSLGPQRRTPPLACRRAPWKSSAKSMMNSNSPSASISPGGLTRPADSIGFRLCILLMPCFAPAWGCTASIWKSPSVTRPGALLREICWISPA